MTRARTVGLHAKLVKLSLVVAATATLLSGCGMHPGAAVVVGDTEISGAEVDDAASALCASTVSSAEAQGQPKPELAARGARQAAVQLLLDSELSRQFGEAEGIEPDQEQLSAALAQNAQGIETVPEAQREDFIDLFRGFQEGQLILSAAGEESLAAQGNDQPSPEEVTAEGARLRTEWARDVDVEVDPRFGDYDQGTVKPVSGSLSIPVSQRAFEGANAEPGTEWTAGLPASQKC